MLFLREMREHQTSRIVKISAKNIIVIETKPRLSLTRFEQKSFNHRVRNMDKQEAPLLPYFHLPDGMCLALLCAVALTQAISSQSQTQTTAVLGHCSQAWPTLRTGTGTTIKLDASLERAQTIA